jgi:uncharacterized RDD family membrane protein YckC
VPSFGKVFLIRYILVWQIPNLLSLFLIQEDDLILNSSSDFSSPENFISLVAFLVLAQSLLIFKSDRRCGHDLISGTIVEKI